LGILVALTLGLLELLLVFMAALLVFCALAGSVLVVFTLAFDRWAPAALLLLTTVFLAAVLVAPLVRLLYLGSAAVTPFAPPTVVFEGLE